MAVPNTFTNGTVADADEVNANFTYVGLVPIGSVISWLKSLTNCPALDDRFVECNGQVLSDAGSVFNGVTIPNLNGASAQPQRFLRGSATSGTTGGNVIPAHVHQVIGYSSTGAAGLGPNTYNNGNSTRNFDTQSYGTGTDVLPYYYGVVFIIRVK